MRKPIIALILLGLSGCGIAAKIESRNEYQDSAAKYKECLQANASTPQNCEGLRLAMETDERKFTNMSAGITPRAQQSSNVTVLSR